MTIEPQGTASLSITATPINGIKVPSGASGASVSVTSGLPSSITASFSQPTVTGSGAVVWTLTLSANTAAQTGSNSLQLAVQITDATSGIQYSSSQNLSLLVSLMANLSIGATPGRAISPTFMGFSHEWNEAQCMMGSTATGVNLIYRQLLKNLTAYGSGPINLRVGGDSTDNSGEPTATTAEPFAEVANALGARFTLGVNLGSDNVTLATNQAQAYMSQMPAGSVEAIEIGNEPDLYVTEGIRPPTYTVQDYFSEFGTWNANITPVLPSGTKLMGPGWSAAGMLSNVQTFESQEAASLAVFSQHAYATSPVDNPAQDFLLSPSAATAGPSAVASAVATTHSYGLPFRMGELSSISDAGVAGISNAFESALWSMDTMFEYANVGVDGVNWEASNGNYDEPFTFGNTTLSGITTYTLNSVAPLYYGLLLYQEATQNLAHLLPVTLSTPANLKAWATLDASGTPRLVVINKDESQEGNVAINLPGYTGASVIFLTAPSYSSTSGVTFGGQTFDGSADGTVQGNRTVETIQGTDGLFQLPMSVTSAALVTFTK
ncbi:MAG: glycosyl hydrolase family 79 C-terminal domain-containing protein [Terracidiphilus sp.]